MKLTIQGQPYSQKRHRTAKSGHRYDPSSKDKKAIQKALLPIKPPKPLTGMLRVNISAYFQTPKSWSQKKQDEVEDMYRPKHPDVDNISKVYLDAMNGYIFEDDRQVVEIFVEKVYSMKPRVQLLVEEI